MLRDIPTSSWPGAVRAWEARTFDALHNRNYRSFFVGQSISLVGTWMQSVAQAWLVLELTGSGTMLGVVVAVQTLPMLLLAPYGGVLADRADKRRLLVATQTSLAILALVLGVLTLGHAVRLWMVLAVAGGLGLTNAVDNPTRQAFVSEMVGSESVANAVILNSVMVNAARAVGPAIAGVLIVTVGVGECFVVNALSFVAVIAALVRMDQQRLRRPDSIPREPGQLVAGLRYVRRTPALLVPVLMMALIGALSYEFQVALPVLARSSFHGNAEAFGFFTAAFGAGAMIGGLAIAGRPARGLRGVVTAAGALGLGMLAAAVAPSLLLESVALAAVGAASVAFMSRGNTTLQLASDESMRGRVMALWAVAFLGTTPIGGPVIGWVCQHLGARWGLAVGGLAALLATALATYPRLRARRDLRHTAARPSTLPTPHRPAEPGVEGGRHA